MPPKQLKDKQALIERRRLYRTLQALPTAHFDEIIFALNPPAGIVSPNQTSQGTRTGELLGWAQGPGGCGLDDVYDLLEEYIPDFERPQLTTEQPAALENSRIFISYKRDIYPDEQIAMGLHQELSKIFNVQIDQSMLIGTKWQAWIDEQLQQADFLIVLLSAASVRSEMVMRELQKACKLAHKQGRPKILPVRLAYRTPFEYPLSEYLNEINWAFWQDETDTPQLINDLQKAIQGEELPINTHALKDELLAPEIPEPMQPPTPMAQPLELPEGTMDGGSQFYVARSSDAIAIDTIQQQGVTITIKGPRQMGKSSLLIRVMNQARSLGKKVVFLDFQFFDRTALDDANLFYRRFCQWLSLRLRLKDETEQWWELYGSMGNPLTCTYYLQDYVLPEVDGPIVLAMDEVESMFSTDFRTDFFGMLRGWHNSRATEPIWKQLDLALVTSTEPYQLIEDLNQSPFNVGQVVELTDFSPERVAELNDRHSSPFSTDQLYELMGLLHGHPYLVRRALYLVASQRMTVNELFERRIEERGPFGDHLRYHLSRVYDHKPLVKCLLQVFDKQTCPDEGQFFKLRGAGLIRREGKRVVPRCRLYEAYFKEHLAG
ncbi:MAG: AAA-like domain-containing protein [Cyanobacteria bacterium P01_C01_bin.73]